jgi:hypothetical protein
MEVGMHQSISLRYAGRDCQRCEGEAVFSREFTYTITLWRAKVSSQAIADRPSNS